MIQVCANNMNREACRCISSFFFLILSFWVSILYADTFSETRQPPSNVNQPIATIEFWGLSRTEPDFLRAVLHSKIGQPFNQQLLQKDLEALSQWNVFQFARAVTRVQENEVLILIEVGERWAIAPIFDGALSGNAAFLQIGLQDSNFLGRGISINGYGGFYRNQQNITPLFGARIQHPHIKGRHWRSDLGFAGNFIIDPVYVYTRSSPVFAMDRRNYEVIAGLGYYLTPRWLVQGYYLFWRSDADASNDYNAAGYESIVNKSVRSHRVGPYIQFKKITFIDPIKKGIEVTLLPYILWSTVQKPTLDLRVVLKTYETVWKDRINFAFQTQLNAVLSKQWVHLRTAGGYSAHVRGYPSRYFHAETIWSQSAEVRITALHQKWLGVQPKVFFDHAFLWGVHQGSMVDDLYNAYSTGAGIYFWVPAITNMHWRLELALPLSAESHKYGLQYNLAVSQFF